MRVLAVNAPAAHHVVAIDGPAASGKSSVARELAKQLGFDYVNSGAMYRAVTWPVLQNAVPPGAVTPLPSARELSHCCDRDGGDFDPINGVDPPKSP